MTVPTCNYNSSPFLAYPMPKGGKGGVPGLGQGPFLLPSYDVPATDTSGGGFWASVLPGLFKTGEQIALQQTLPKGYYQQTGPGGTISYVQPAGPQPSILTAAAGQVSASGQASPGIGMILVAGAAVLLVFMVAGRKK